MAESARDRPELPSRPEQDICVQCGVTVPKPETITGPLGFYVFTPIALCQPCGEAWRWREQICVKRPWQVPLWRPKKDPAEQDGHHDPHP